MKKITITYSPCGHRATIDFHPHTAPRVGDVLYCYECGQYGTIARAQVHDDARTAQGIRHHHRRQAAIKRAQRARRF